MLLINDQPKSPKKNNDAVFNKRHTGKIFKINKRYAFNKQKSPGKFSKNVNVPVHLFRTREYARKQSRLQTNTQRHI